MNEETMELYIKRIARFGAEYIYGFPSAIDMLAEFVGRHSLQGELPHFRAALLISEGVTSLQRRRIEQVFGTRAFSFYGHSERVIMGGECECNTTYHHFPDYGVMEIIAEDGHVCAQEGERGELVGTGFLNYSMPLIRYCTGDFATRCAYDCECGRKWDRFSNVEGRWKQDMLIGRTGARMSIAALNMHGSMFKNVIRYQYFQEEPGRCVLRVLPAPQFTQEDERVILDAYRQKVGDEVSFSIEVVKDIPLTQRGKLRLLDSRINNTTEWDIALSK
jgi:phenylacetate-CoA ligase